MLTHIKINIFDKYSIIFLTGGFSIKLLRNFIFSHNFSKSHNNNEPTIDIPIPSVATFSNVEEGAPQSTFTIKRNVPKAGINTRINMIIKFINFSFINLKRKSIIF